MNGAYRKIQWDSSRLTFAVPEHNSHLLIRPVTGASDCSVTKNTKRPESQKAKNHTGKAKLNNLYFTASSNRNNNITRSGCDSPIPALLGRHRVKLPCSPLKLASDPVLPVLQIVRRHYRRAFDYKTYRLATCMTRYKETNSSYSFIIVKPQVAE